MQLCLIKGRGSVSGILFLFSVRGGFKAVQAPFWGAGWARKTAVKKCSRSFLFSVCVFIYVYVKVCGRSFYKLL